MREAEIEAIFVSRVKRAGGLAFKFVSPGNTGVPDRIVIFPGGKIWFVELKTPIGRVAQQQKLQMDRLQAHGCNTFVIYGTDGIDDFFREARPDAV